MVQHNTEKLYIRQSSQQGSRSKRGVPVLHAILNNFFSAFKKFLGLVCKMQYNYWNLYVVNIHVQKRQ